MRKILYSPGYGAGWTTWCHGGKEHKLFMLTWQPAIDVLERKTGGKRRLTADEIDDLAELFEKEWNERFPEEDIPYLGGMSGLAVMEVSGRVRIHEYDGSERVEEENSFDDWL